MRKKKKTPSVTFHVPGAVFALMDHLCMCQETVRDLLMDLDLLSNPNTGRWGGSAFTPAAQPGIGEGGGAAVARTCGRVAQEAKEKPTQCSPNWYLADLSDSDPPTCIVVMINSFVFFSFTLRVLYLSSGSQSQENKWTENDWWMLFGVLLIRSARPLAEWVQVLFGWFNAGI